MEPLGLYIHVPFCRSRCHYCDFYAETGRGPLLESYGRALCEEWRLLRREVLDGDRPRIATIYFGGGTPSHLPAQILTRFLDLIARESEWDGEIEITLEANPESVTPEKVRAWRLAGIGRVSLGVQSFSDPVLRRLGRPHGAAEILRSVACVRSGGMPRLSLDLIYGLGEAGGDPQGRAYRRSVEEALAIDPGHVSCYLLSAPEGTLFGRRIATGPMRLAADERAAGEYAWTLERLRASGYEPYEISSFARPGEISRHNERYWLRQPYLGLGPGAHSLWNGQRWSVPPDLPAYLRAVLEERSLPRRDLMTLDARQILEEEIFLGLRRTAGIDWGNLRRRLPAPVLAAMEPALARLAAHGYIRIERGRMALTDRALFVSNAVIVTLLAAFDRWDEARCRARSGNEEVGAPP